MFYISHRGNLNGPDTRYENSIEYINHALERGFDVEVDVHYFKGNFYLGHDEPTFQVSLDFLENKKLWCHAKSMDTMGAFYKTKCHYFWHETDAVTLTNKGYYWTYPGNKLFENSICVLPEKSDYKSFFCKGICSDYILKYKNND
jgi:hypothetical protein